MLCKATHCYFYPGGEEGAACGMAKYLDQFGRCCAYDRLYDPDEARKMRAQIRRHLQDADAVAENLADYVRFRGSLDERPQ